MANVVQIVLQGKDNFSGVLRGITSQLGGFRSLLAAVGATAAAGTLLHLTKEAIDTADQMNLLAQRTGIAVDQLSALSYAAKLSDVDSGALQTAIKGLSKTMVEAGHGGADVRETLLGVADEFANAADGASKTARAVQLFGKSGQEMIPLLNQGREALEAQFKEAEKFGQVVGPAFARNADMFNDNMDRLKSAFSGVFLQVADHVLPILVAYSEALVNLIKNSDLVERSVQILSTVVTSMAKGVLLATEAWITFTGLLTGKSFAEIGGEINAMEADIAAFTESLKTISATPVKKEAGIIVDEKDLEKALRLQEDLQASRHNGAYAVIEQSKIALGRQIADIEKLKIAESDKREVIELAELVHQENLDRMIRDGTIARLDFARNVEDADIERQADAVSAMQAAHLADLQERQEAVQRFQNAQLIGHRQHVNAKLLIDRGYVAATGGILGDLATIAKAFGKEGFVAYKAISSAQAIIAAYLSATRALAEVPWPLNYVAAAVSLAAGLANVAVINSTNIGGQAHGGLDYVPEESTFLLNRGERVLQPQANQDLTAFLEGSGGGGPTQIAIYLDGAILGQGIGQLSRDGRLEISAKAIAA